MPTGRMIRHCIEDRGCDCEFFGLFDPIKESMMKTMKEKNVICVIVFLNLKHLNLKHHLCVVFHSEETSRRGNVLSLDGFGVAPTRSLTCRDLA